MDNFQASIASLPAAMESLTVGGGSSQQQRDIGDYPAVLRSNVELNHLTLPAHGHAVVTSLLISHGRIISASDDQTIRVYSASTGSLVHVLEEHEGGVWCLAATKDTLVSGATDTTVRVWDLRTGRCTHVFGGHTGTVRCIAIAKPEWIYCKDEQGDVTLERGPKRPLIVSGSRDGSLRVWTLPKPGDREFRYRGGAGDANDDGSEGSEDENPYHQLHLVGHDASVRALVARGRTAVSGSYDCTVRVWDIVTGKCTWVCTGHTQKVYAVALDLSRNIACSGSMDGTVRIWGLGTGQCQHVLTGHSSLVGLIAISPSHLVSGAADGTLRVWNPDTGELRHGLSGKGAVTCFQHDERKVLFGCEGQLRMWDVRDGSHVRDMLTGVAGVWEVAFKGRWCVAASNRENDTVLDVWDFAGGESADGVGDEESEYGDDDVEMDTT